MQNCIRSLIPWQVSEKNMPIPRKAMDGFPATSGGQKKKQKKKDSEQCTKDSA